MKIKEDQQSLDSLVYKKLNELLSENFELKQRINDLEERLFIKLAQS